MSTPLCAGPNCGSLPQDARSRRTGNHGLRLCTGCYRELKGDLVKLLEIYDDCEPAPLARNNPIVQRVSGTRGSGGIFLDERAIAIRSRILGLLSCWAALVADERAIGRPPRRHPATLVAFLIDHLSWLLAHPTAANFAEEIHLLATDARGSAGSQQATPRVDLGPCVHPGCAAEMNSAPATRNGQSTPEVRCAAGHAWPPHQWLRLLAQIRQGQERIRDTDPQQSVGAV